MKFRDFLLVVCLVALVALGLRQASIRSGVGEPVSPVAIETPEMVDAPVGRLEARPTLEYPEEPVRSRGSSDTGFRIRRITASVMADNESDDEKAAIAGFVRSDLALLPGSGKSQYLGARLEQSESVVADRVTTINSEPVSVSDLQIDGIRWAVYEQHWLESTLGKPEQLGTVDSQGRRYHRWSWPGRRDFVLVESASGSGLYPVKMVGREFVAGGSVVLSAGDSEEKAVAVLGERLRKIWGTEIAVAAQVSDGRVTSIALEELAPVPSVPLSIR